jgi:serine/threonine-protein kinase RsbW
MRQLEEQRIFARNEPSGFVGRTAQLERILQRAKGESGPGGIVLLAAPFTGSSELMRQAYDRLFSEQEEIIPFYFEIRPADRTAQNAALRFLCEFLLQTVAFRRRDPNIIAASPVMGEIAELAAPADGYWIDRLVAAYRGEPNLNGERSFVRNCLSAPLRAAANSARTFVMIDGLHLASTLIGGEEFLDDITDIFSRSSVPFVLGGLRRFLFARMPLETISVEPLSFAEAGHLVEMLSKKTGVLINDQTRDLIAVQLGGHPGHITSLFTSAASRGEPLNSFEHVEQSYTNEIFGGRICRNFNTVLERIAPDARTQINILQLISELMAAGDNKTPLAYWKKHLGLANGEFKRAIDALNHYEIVSVGSGCVEMDETNLVLGDYVIGRSRLEIDADTRALVVGEALSFNVKRAPVLMARFYRRTSAIGLRSLMQAFDGRQIPASLIDYSRFKDELKGRSDLEISEAVDADPVKFDLPRIIYTAHTAAFYPRLNELCDAERSAVALGFIDTAEKDEIVWIAAEIDSKLEATAELAEFWCDRLEMVALNCGFREYRIWLVAPEGFDPEAIEVLRGRNANGSSRKQVDLMIGILKPDLAPDARTGANEYEIVVPMGEDTEMIAAHAVEDIAKRYNFPAKAINQIKTALVEACINAAEHSLSPDQKIYQKFAVDDEKIVITVANRGLRIADATAQPTNEETGRRGWGLRLMKGLMDSVKIEKTDDGTLITMVKFRGETTTA